MSKIMTNQGLNTFLKESARSESYDKEGNNAHGFNKGVRATLIALCYDEQWVERVFRDRYEDFVSMTKY